MKKKFPISRRDFIRLSAAVSAGVSILPLEASFSDKVPLPLMRDFGRLDFKVTTLGLGGQASLQWTPDDVDPVSIILKAFDLGINYFDTSNLYGLSQLNYHQAFQRLNLIPGEKSYDKNLRKSIMLTSKTLMRWGKSANIQKKNVFNGSNGKDVKCAIDDLKRTLSQVFGDGNGYYPEGSYLDLMLIHAVTNIEELDVLYQGLETPINSEETIGALVALRDFRDGTNLTGTNPQKEKLIKHIGFSGHKNPSVMMEMIQRDEYGLLDGLLVSINSNDKLYFNMQNNVIPVAKAKGMGVIGMKVFADGAMYDKEARFSKTSSDVYRKVGSLELPSSQLIEYVLSSPNVDTLIIGVGHIDDDPLKCQLTQNFYASQIQPSSLSKDERLKIEQKTAKIKEGKTNYFQLEEQGLSSPRNVRKEKKGNKIIVSWHTAYAAASPISHYEIAQNNKIIGTVKHSPQISKTAPFSFEVDSDNFTIYTVDEDGNKA